MVWQRMCGYFILIFISIFPQCNPKFINRSGYVHWRTQEEISGGLGYRRPRRASGGERPGRRRIFENLQKIP